MTLQTKSAAILFCFAASILLVGAGCGDDSTSFCDSIKPGLWRYKYTLRSDSDRECDPIADRTIALDENTEGGDPSCEQGCTCTRNSNDVECTFELEQVCANSSLTCDWEL